MKVWAMTVKTVMEAQCTSLDDSLGRKQDSDAHETLQSPNSAFPSGCLDCSLSLFRPFLSIGVTWDLSGVPAWASSRCMSDSFCSGLDGGRQGVLPGCKKCKLAEAAGPLDDFVAYDEMHMTNRTTELKHVESHVVDDECR
eukprot:3708843-Pleurochrysis_carterae.AAC.1